jgi:lipopolysaccharide/colanic/teichoic acid biosynthesis glycosyltransferase
MNDKVDSNNMLLPDKKRLTRIGKVIRKYSIDELLQLVNVLKGDMSLIGPRPLLMEYLPLYNKFQSRRHDVKPGITGWAQVNGRNAISWEEKFEHDVWYVNSISFSLDIKILFLTLQKVIRTDGINSDTAATMEKFSGSIKTAE